jgi:ELWxxDGT repeat protein
MRSASNGPFGYARLLLLGATAALVVWSTANAAVPQLVRNINDAVIPEGSFPREIGILNGKLLFAASDTTARGLWITDGTAAGTVLLKRFPGQGGLPEFSPDTRFAVLGPRAYFVADDGVVGSELWTTDGTPAGTTLVADVRPGSTGGLNFFLGVFDGRLIFSAQDGIGTSQIFITDGTASGTSALTSFGVFSLIGGPPLFAIADDRFYFVARDDVPEIRIWVSDGTPGGTHALTNPGIPAPSFSTPHFFTRVGNRVLYSDGPGFWRIDLATNAIDALTWNDPVHGPRQVSATAPPIALGGLALLISEGPVAGSLELWRTDGTSGGTFKVGGIHAGPAPIELREGAVFSKVGDKAIYLADDGVNGQQLWSSDGSIANTVQLTNVSLPGFSQIATPLGTVGDVGYYMLPDGPNATTLSVWRSDGTIAGTHKIAGLPAVEILSAPPARVAGDGTSAFLYQFRSSDDAMLWKYNPASEQLTQLRSSVRAFPGDMFFHDGQRLYYTENDRVTGNEPHVSDGTVAGTRLLRDIVSQGTADNGSAPNEFVEFAGRAVFAATHDDTGRELWISDGTEAGTTLLADLNPGFASSNPSRLVVANGALYFFATDANDVSHFMRLASPTDQPEIIADLTPPFVNPQLCARDTPVAFGGNVYFPASAGFGLQVFLWKSDGTAAGTMRVTNTNEITTPCELTVYNDRLYFGALGNFGKQLYSTDGTSAGTVKVSALAGGTQGGNVAGLTLFNGLLYFTAEDSSFKSELWKTSGTSTARVFAFNSTPFLRALSRGIVNNKLLIELFDPGRPPGFMDPRQLWTSDGTATGTVLLKDIVTDNFPDLAVINGRGYFAARNAGSLEPWVTDGTIAGTQELKNINGGDSNPAWFADFHSVPLFTAIDANGPQLWRTDGTEAGTTALAGIPAPPPTFLNPQAVMRQQAAIGQKFFFVARDHEIGDELYVLINETPVAGADSGSSANSAPATINVLANDSDADGTLVAQSVRVATNPANGSVAINANGTLVYTPAAAFSGTDTFTYTVDDNQGATSNAATVTMTVTAPPPPPPPTVVTTGRRSGGGSMGAGALAVLLLLGLTRRASSIRF